MIKLLGRPLVRSLSTILESSSTSSSVFGGSTSDDDELDCRTAPASIFGVIELVVGAEPKTYELRLAPRDQIASGTTPPVVVPPLPPPSVSFEDE